MYDEYDEKSPLDEFGEDLSSTAQNVGSMVQQGRKAVNDVRDYLNNRDNKSGPDANNIGDPNGSQVDNQTSKEAAENVASNDAQNYNQAQQAQQAAENISAGKKGIDAGTAGATAANAGKSAAEAGKTGTEAAQAGAEMAKEGAEAAKAGAEAAKAGAEAGKLAAEAGTAAATMGASLVVEAGLGIFKGAKSAFDDLTTKEGGGDAGLVGGLFKAVIALLIMLLLAVVFGFYMLSISSSQLENYQEIQYTNIDKNREKSDRNLNYIDNDDTKITEKLDTEHPFEYSAKEYKENTKEALKEAFVNEATTIVEAMGTTLLDKIKIGIEKALNLGFYYNEEETKKNFWNQPYPYNLKISKTKYYSIGDYLYTVGYTDKYFNPTNYKKIPEDKINDDLNYTELTAVISQGKDYSTLNGTYQNYKDMFLKPSNQQLMFEMTLDGLENDEYIWYEGYYHVNNEENDDDVLDEPTEDEILDEPIDDEILGLDDTRILAYKDRILVEDDTLIEDVSKLEEDDDELREEDLIEELEDEIIEDNLPELKIKGYRNGDIKVGPTTNKDDPLFEKCYIKYYYLKPIVKPFGLRELYTIAGCDTEMVEDYEQPGDQPSYNHPPDKAGYNKGIMNFQMLDYTERYDRIFARMGDLGNAGVEEGENYLGPSCTEKRSELSWIYGETHTIDGEPLTTGRSANYYIPKNLLVNAGDLRAIRNKDWLIGDGNIGIIPGERGYDDVTGREIKPIHGSVMYYPKPNEDKFKVREINTDKVYNVTRSTHDYFSKESSYYYALRAWPVLGRRLRALDDGLINKNMAEPLKYKDQNGEIYYVGAMVDGFAHPGDIIETTFANGQSLKMIIVDVKSLHDAKGTGSYSQIDSSYGHGAINPAKTQINLCALEFFTGGSNSGSASVKGIPGNGSYAIKSEIIGRISL